ncbi:MAG: hypothetical protein J0H43_01395, partial [Actinobacteria bacterium]|nr:hypothetical protein [Actinomycetota bacterium]
MLLRVSARVGACAGLGGIVVGSFLPWLHSGSRTRDSYAADGVLRNTLQPGGAIPALLHGWPYLSLACALAAALLLAGPAYSIHLARLGAVVALICAGVAGTVTGWALDSAPRSGLIRLAPPGPLVTLISAIAAGLCALGGFLLMRRITA